MDTKCLTEGGINLRTALRGLRRGRSLLIECRDRRDQLSKRANAYQLAAHEGMRFNCVMGDGCVLLVTRTM